MNPPRTQFAQKALDLATSFEIMVGTRPLEGTPRYKVAIATPEGPSTGGGVQSTQHISLTPEGGGAAIVVGSANQAANTAEVRSFACLAQIQARRAPGVELAINPVAYEELLGKMKSFFESLSMTVTTVEATETPATQAPSSAGVEPAGKRPFPWALVGGIAALVVVVVAALILRHH